MTIIFIKAAMKNSVPRKTTMCALISMAMCGNYIQRVKIVINNNIFEQVTDFKYLGYRISEYKSDLEDKLQTYNKIN